MKKILSLLRFHLIELFEWATTSGNIKSNVYLYYSGSMKGFGHRCLTLYGWNRYYSFTKVKPTDTVIFWLYSKHAYRLLDNCKTKRIVFWQGSDILKLESNPGFLKVIWSNPFVRHVCHSKAQSDKLQQICQFNIRPSIRPWLMDDINKYLPEHELIPNTHYIYAPKGREKEYGLFEFLELALNNESGEYHVFGGYDESPLKNVYFHPWMSQRDFEKATANLETYYMYHVNAGISQVAIMATLRGQTVISKYTDIYNFKSRKELLKVLNNFDWVK